MRGEERQGAARRQRRGGFERTVDELGQRVVRGDYDGLGLLPVESELAAELGVGRNLMREAVKTLAGKGLVEVRRKRGTTVRARATWSLLDPDVLRWIDGGGARLEHSFDLVEFRLIVEPKASHLAALRATAEERRLIERACTELEACVGHPEHIAARDLAFHGSILAASHNAILHHLGSMLASLMQSQVLTTTDRPGLFEKGLPLHREVAEAILKGDPAQAEHASRRLVTQPYDDLASRLSLPPERRIAADAEDPADPITSS